MQKYFPMDEVVSDIWPNNNTNFVKEGNLLSIECD